MLPTTTVAAYPSSVGWWDTTELGVAGNLQLLDATEGAGVKLTGWGHPLFAEVVIVDESDCDSRSIMTVWPGCLEVEHQFSFLPFWTSVVEPFIRISRSDRTRRRP